MEFSDRDHEQARIVIELYGEDATRVIDLLSEVVRREWPKCKSFSGAVQKYLSAAGELLKSKKRREEARQAAEERRRSEEASAAQVQSAIADLNSAWEELPGPKQAEIRRYVMADNLTAPESFIRRLCLEELSSRLRTGRL